MSDERAGLGVATFGAGATLVGAVLSGPVGLLAVGATHPQPAWQGPELFARSYHPVQTLPFFLGFVLVGGFVALVAGLHAAAPPGTKGRSSAALVFTAAFAALVFLNYVLQTTFVPALARHYSPAEGPLLAALTMANPRSLAWGLEMWGYGLLGVATWLVAPVFGGSRLERAAAWALVASGPASIAPAFLTALVPGWVLSGPGLVGFALWNVLVVVLALLALLALRERQRRGSVSPLTGAVATPT